MSSSSSAGLIVLIVLLFVGLMYTVLNIVAVVKIITKAGYSGAWVPDHVGPHRRDNYVLCICLLQVAGP